VTDLARGSERDQIGCPIQPVPRQHRRAPHHHRQRNGDDDRC
jgi:hypothetical protein